MERSDALAQSGDGIQEGPVSAVRRAVADAQRDPGGSCPLVETIVRALGWDAGALWAIHRDAGVLCCVESWEVDGLDSGFMASTTAMVFAPGVGLPGRAWLGRSPLSLSDVTAEPNFPRAPAAASAGLHGAFAVPVCERTRVLGVVEFFRRERAGPAAEELDAVDAIAAEIVARLHSAIADLGLPPTRDVRAAARQAAIAEFGRGALTREDIEAVTGDAVGVLAEGLNVEYAAILELNSERQTLRLRDAIGWPEGAAEEEVPATGSSLAGFTLLSDAPVVVEDFGSESRFGPHPLLADRGIASGASVLIRGRARPLGVLTVHSETPRRFSSEDVYFMRAIANMLAAAIDRQRAEAEVRRSESLLQSIIGGTTDAVFVKNLEGQYLMMNEAGARILGRDPEEIVGQRDSDLFDEATFSELREHDLSVMEEASWSTFEEVVGPPENRRIYLSAKGPYVDAAGEVIGVIGVSHEITARKREEVFQRLLGESSRVLALSLDHERTLDEIANLAVPELAEWCALDILDEHGDIQHVALAHADPAKLEIARGLRENYPPDPGSTTGVAQVLRSGEPEIHLEVTDEALVRAARDEKQLELLRALELSSVMIVPMVARRRRLGTMTLATGPDRRFSEEDLLLAQELAYRAGLAVDNSRLYRERSHIADTLQRSLLPGDLPEVPGVRLAARFHAAGEGYDVGGDFYDIYQTDHHWALVIGDVCGKGPEAAAVTGLARYTLRAAAMKESRPSVLLGTLNEALLEQLGDFRFCTVAFCLLGPRDGSANLRVASGGHHPPLLVRAGGEIEPACRPGPLIGVMEEIEMEEAEWELSPGDLVVLFTDGLIETRGASDWGQSELEALLRDSAGSPAEVVAANIEQAALRAHGGTPPDDLAILVAEVLPKT